MWPPKRSRLARVFQTVYIFVYIHTMTRPPRAILIKRLICGLALAWLAAASLSQAANAAELLAVMRADCPYCRAWEIEVGSLYGRTDESRIAPLRRVGIDQLSRTRYVFSEPVRYTPTFILLDRDVEVGRIVGYSNDAMFWGMLTELLDRMQRGKREMAREAEREF